MACADARGLDAIEALRFSAISISLTVSIVRRDFAYQLRVIFSVASAALCHLRDTAARRRDSMKCVRRHAMALATIRAQFRCRAAELLFRYFDFDVSAGPMRQNISPAAGRRAGFSR